jgi:hypothetical protein
VALIDIKPGDKPNCFNNDGNGVIPVAIYGSPGLDVTQIILPSTRLQGMPVATHGPDSTPATDLTDLNKDGFPDLVVQIQDMAGTFGAGASYATLTAQLADGRVIWGLDTVCVVK